MKVLLTGASGFLGGIIHRYLENHEVQTVGRKPSDQWFFDFEKSAPISITGSFDSVIHCAGKAHIYPKSEEEKRLFYQINAQGTDSFLQSLKNVSIRQFVFISSVSVYGLESGENIAENHPLLGASPYAKSKIKAEKLIAQWCDARAIPYVILRLPLIAGENPPGNLGKMINGIKSGFYFSLGGGKARKSMVMGEDIAKLILRIENKSGIYNLTDGKHPSFAELGEQIATQVGRKRLLNMPMVFARILSIIGDSFKMFPLNSDMVEKMTESLTFDDQKAREDLAWSPRSVLKGLKID